MAVTVKAPHEIELMRESCKRLAIVHDEIGKMIEPGISTLELDRKAYELIRELGGTPNFLHYHGYPGTICASI
ncbi:MAG: M24 family metallopeptidase, partial [Lachnospiraceae bacterium]|nr:M24 family metallopeptidase [Lachnospiraceae bacterium]